MEPHFDDLEQSGDHHPTIDDRYIEVFVGGNHQEYIEVYYRCLLKSTLPDYADVKLKMFLNAKPY